jgi:hypothetical protein
MGAATSDIKLFAVCWRSGRGGQVFVHYLSSSFEIGDFIALKLFRCNLTAFEGFASLRSCVLGNLVFDVEKFIWDIFSVNTILLVEEGFPKVLKSLTILVELLPRLLVCCPRMKKSCEGLHFKRYEFVIYGLVPVRPRHAKILR